MKYKFRYIDKLEPIQFQPRMTIGRVVHEAFDMHYKGGANADIIEYISDEFGEALSNAELVDQEALIVAKFTALGMFIHNPWKNLSEYTAIESELPFRVRVGNTRSVRFIGKIDRMLEYDGRWWVNELKTTGLSQRQFESRCQTSVQGTAYTYAARKNKYKPVGIIFHCIKRPLLRKLKHENADDFGRRIFKDYGDHKKKDHYFQRTLSYRNDIELSLFEKDFERTVQELRWRTKGNRWYRNTDECWNFNVECPYKKICFTDKPDDLTIELFYKRRGDANKENGSSKEQRCDNGCSKGAN